MNRSTELLSILNKKMADFEYQSQWFNTGTVLSVKDNIVVADGLREVYNGEIVIFSSGERGFVISIESDITRILLLDNFAKVHEGEEVRTTGQSLKIPVGMSMLGRVVDALGNPVDEKGPTNCTETYPIENEGFGVIARSRVCEAMQTGIKSIDTLFPIGRGQRELIIGDRQTGKTSIAIDTIVNQKHAFENNIKDQIVYCIYVAIGQRKASIARIVNELADHGALPYTVIVEATSSDTAAMQYLAPYTGCAIGEYFMQNGYNALIVYDDLSKHAVAYRQISLLLQRPSGRDAYPGDIFYLHSRLLERAAKLNKELGGGSLTALPIIETQAGDLSAYIPTNVISITDGQIVLEANLFNAGIRPAVNTGLSVSRIGSSAQTKAIKKFASALKFALAQYRNIASFAQLSSSVDPVTKQIVEKGKKLVELLKQNRFETLSMAEEAILLFAVTRHHADGIAVQNIQKYAKIVVEIMRNKHADVLQHIMDTTDIDETTTIKITEILKTIVI